MLKRAGWVLTPPASQPGLLRARDVADLVGCGLERARGIMRVLPGTVRLPGDDLRSRREDLDAWIDSHRIQKEAA